MYYSRRLFVSSLALLLARQHMLAGIPTGVGTPAPLQAPAGTHGGKVYKDGGSAAPMERVKALRASAGDAGAQSPTPRATPSACNKTLVSEDVVTVKGPWSRSVSSSMMMPYKTKAAAAKASSVTGNLPASASSKGAAQPDSLKTPTRSVASHQQFDHNSTHNDAQRCQDLSAELLKVQQMLKQEIEQHALTQLSLQRDQESYAALLEKYRQEWHLHGVTRVELKEQQARVLQKQEQLQEQQARVTHEQQQHHTTRLRFLECQADLQEAREQLKACVNGKLQWQIDLAAQYKATIMGCSRHMFLLQKELTASQHAQEEYARIAHEKMAYSYSLELQLAVYKAFVEGRIGQQGMGQNSKATLMQLDAEKDEMCRMQTEMQAPRLYMSQSQQVTPVTVVTDAKQLQQLTAALNRRHEMVPQHAAALSAAEEYPAAEVKAVCEDFGVVTLGGCETTDPTSNHRQEQRSREQEETGQIGQACDDDVHSSRATCAASVRSSDSCNSHDRVSSSGSCNSGGRCSSNDGKARSFLLFSGKRCGGKSSKPCSPTTPSQPSQQNNLRVRRGFGCFN